MTWINTPESSNVAGFGYDAEAEELTVEFNNGGRYVYRDVPKSVYDGLKRASSKGSYLARRIKGTYRFVKES